MKIKIYCEAGAMSKQVKNLKRFENVELIGFPFESINRKVKTAINPSELSADSTFITADNEEIRVSDIVKSEMFEKISVVIGKNNFNDIRHIDTAYKENCKIFITPDKGDIISKAYELQKLTKISFFHFQNIQEIEMEILNLVKLAK